MTDHTPEPWEAVKHVDCWGVYQADSAGRIATTDFRDAKANAARIVACVNACAGIPTEQLGDAAFLAQAAEEMTDHTPEHCTCAPLPEPIDDNCPEHGERRVEACLAACAGIPTEQLGDVKALVEAAGAAPQYIYLAYVQEGQAKRDELAGIAKRDFDALDAALAPFRKDNPEDPQRDQWEGE